MGPIADVVVNASGKAFSGGFGHYGYCIAAQPQPNPFNHKEHNGHGGKTESKNSSWIGYLMVSNADRAKPYHGSTRISRDNHGSERDDILRAVNTQKQSGVAKGPGILLLLAVAIFAAGAVRYYRHGSFTLVQAGYCLVAVVISLAVLLIFDYTLHHAKIVAVMVLVFVVLYLFLSPAFCVGMGLGLAGMVVVQSRG